MFDRLRALDRRNLVVLFGILLLGGCANMIAPKIVAPQNGDAREAMRKAAGGQLIIDDLNAYVSRHLAVNVGPPPANLAVEIVPPGDYSMTFRVERHNECRVLYLTGSAQARLIKDAGHLWLKKWAVEHDMPTAKAKDSIISRRVHIAPTAPPPEILRQYRLAIARLRSTRPPRGTIILLPGDGNGMLSMLPWALMLGRAGYQSILVDLRAQGQSTGRYVTYGILESRDMVQLVNVLRASGLIRGRLGILGDSLGAATALLAAPRISGLEAIVAISPYTRATSVIPRFARRFYWYAKFIPQSSWRAAERIAGRIAGVNLSKAAPIAVVSQIRVPVLYLQGGQDYIVGLKQARNLEKRTIGAEMRVYPKLGHVAMSVAYADLAHSAIDWFNRYVAKDDKSFRVPRTRQRPKNSFSLAFCNM